MAKKKKTTRRKPKRKPIDWDGIEKEYVANQISIKAIARAYKCSDAAIINKAKKQGWKRNLANAVKAGIKEELVRNEVSAKVSGEVSVRNVSDKESIDHAVARGADIIRSHRSDIRQMRALEDKFLAELNGEPTKLYVAQFKGMVITKTLNLTVSEKASTLQSLSNVQHKRIQLERQAYNLNDGDDGDEESRRVTGIEVEFVD